MARITVSQDNPCSNSMLYALKFSDIKSLTKDNLGNRTLFLSGGAKKIGSGYRRIWPGISTTDYWRDHTLPRFDLTIDADLTRELQEAIDKIELDGDRLVLACLHNNQIILQGVTEDIELVGIHQGFNTYTDGLVASFFTRSSKPPLVVDCIVSEMQ